LIIYLLYPHIISLNLFFLIVLFELNPLSNYIHAATLLFLFTNTPDTALGGGLTNTYYIIPSLLNSYYKPTIKSSFFFNDTFVTSILPLPSLEKVFNFSPDRISCALELPLQGIASLLRKPIAVKNEIDLIDIMEPYTREILWFEIYAAVQCGTHTMDFKETPSVKLYYPEPFVATPSFVHEDVWFLHILRYAH